MGQKVNPIVFRIGLTRTWGSSWYAEKKQFGQYLYEDVKVKELIRNTLKNCGIAEIGIERSRGSVTVKIYSSKPGVIIGKKGDNVEKIKSALEAKFQTSFNIEIKEVSVPDLSSYLVGENIAQQIEKRIPYRRAVKQSIERVMQNGAKGVKIRIAGRLNGAEIARVELAKEGNIPLHTLRADIDYAKVEAHTTYGVIGIQIWIYKGMKFKS